MMETTIDLSDFKADIPYDDALKLCQELGLIEIVWHGKHDYGRLTQKGINVMNAMMVMISHTASPENILKVT